MAVATQGDESSVMMPEDYGGLTTSPLSLLLIGPDADRRAALGRDLKAAHAVSLREYAHYPELDQIEEIVAMQSDVVIVELDSAPEYALEIVETLCAASAATVMVYGRGADVELMIRSMRAGAREFLTVPVSENDLGEALVRASARRSTKNWKKSDGILSVFWGAKGGSGVTTLATSFAVASAQDLNRNALLIDFDLPLGDAALQLGLTPQYSTAEALANHSRLDANFLSRLLVKHSSGLSVLAAPGKFIKVNYTTDAVNKLLQVARQQFDCVIVDSGSRAELIDTSALGAESNLYLVSQVGLAELRNSNRIITELLQGNTARLQVILNRYSTSMLNVDEQHITRALTIPAHWRIPEAGAAARKTHETGTPLTLHDSAISRLIQQMARAASGLPAEPAAKKKLLGLF